MQVPMCFCSSLCKLMKSKVLGYDFGMRFLCARTMHTTRRSVTARIDLRYNMNVMFVVIDLTPTSNLCWTKSPPPLCDFMQWLDMEQTQQDKEWVQLQARWATERWQRMLHEEEKEEKRKKEQEEIRKRIQEVERQEAEEREADRERKRKRERRAKKAGPDAIRKDKYPR